MPDIAAAARALDGMANVLAQLLPRRKSIADTTVAFGADLNALARAAWRSRMRVSTFAGQMRDLLATALREAYIEGLAEGGVGEDEMDREDEHIIRDAIRAQAAFVDGFAQAVIEARGEADLQPAIEQRVGYWSKSIRALGIAGLNSAKENQVVIFAGVQGAENCATCRSLMGERHRRSWFVARGWVPGVPGNCKQANGSGFECCGYQCAHVLSPVGRAVRPRGYVPYEPQPMYGVD